MSKTTIPTALGKPIPKKPSVRDQALAFAESKADSAQRTRLNANIKVELHRALKMRAASEGKTIGDLIEQWIGSWAK